MKNFKYLFLSIAIVLSFYFTDKIMLFINYNNPLMKTIVEKKDTYYVKPVSAIIDNNTIVPGINGKTVDEKKSLIKMEDYGSFNETFLVYDILKPDISLNDNREKIIIRGNSKKRNVSLVLEGNAEQQDYLNSLKIKYSLLSYLNTDLNLNNEYINGENSTENFSDLDTVLNKNNLNKKICIIKYSNIEECKKLKYYLVSVSLTSSENIYEVINKISSGEIILIKSSTNINNLKLIIDEITRQNLKIVYLSEIISEKN